MRTNSLAGQLIVFFMLTVCSAIALAQNAPDEKLTVSNSTDKPIEVSIQAHGRNSPPGWQGPFTVEANGSPLEIPLGGNGGYGFQPFDITIRQGDTALVFSATNLCTKMADCRNRGVKSWNLSAAVYHRRQGDLIDVLDRRVKAVVVANIAENHVEVPFADIRYERTR